MQNWGKHLLKSVVFQIIIIQTASRRNELTWLSAAVTLDATPSSCTPTLAETLALTPCNSTIEQIKLTYYQHIHSPRLHTTSIHSLLQMICKVWWTQIQKDIHVYLLAI